MRVLYRLAILGFTLTLCACAGEELVNSIGIRLVRVPAGTFQMGETATLHDDLLTPLTYPRRDELIQRYPNVTPSQFRIPFEAFRHGDFDERPVHRVTISRGFFLGTTEVTNVQYERFDPSHRALRGKRGFSPNDDDAVVFVDWYEARAFCAWLSKQEGRPYRMPTEAEWEYAARAGTRTPFTTGALLPLAFLKNARATSFQSAEDIVPLTVGRTPANPWGLFDMHGNVEEWTNDWYGPYAATPQTDPTGRSDGDFRVTRGGSHGTDPYYLRSANRIGSLPGTRSWLIGFRVVQGDAPSTPPVPAEPPRPAPRAAVARQAEPDAAVPYFRGPRRFVRIPPGSHGPLYTHHNHDTAIAECPNGDLLAIWYTCEQERGRELAVASARLRQGATEWDAALPFWDTPDRNDHCPALWFDGDRTLYHFNGVSVAGRWEPLAIVLRTSRDNGATWSRARPITDEYGYRNMVGQPVFRARDGSIVFAADAGGGSTVWVGREAQGAWREAGGTARGVHAGVAQLLDGSLLALGRGQDIDGWMPMSVSPDLGRTWTSRASPLPPIGGGQRPVLLRLREGPLFFAAFAEDPARPAPVADVTPRRGAMSLYAALSYDEGQTWPVRRIVTDGLPEHPAQTIDGARIRMSPGSSEPQGYLAATQSRDGVIHLISSINHYSFNRAWLEQTPRSTIRTPIAQDNPRPYLTLLVEASTGGYVEVWEPGSALITQHYRFAVRPGMSRIVIRQDTAAQVWHEGSLDAVLAPETLIDWRLPARGRHVQATSGARVVSVR